MSMDELLARVAETRAQTTDAARTAATERAHGAGRMTCRERVDALVDPGTFREIGALAGPLRDNAFNASLVAPADGHVCGTARIDGRPVAVVAIDGSIAGGSMGVVGSHKMTRLMDLANDGGYPLVMIVEGGGHRIQDGLDARSFAVGGAWRIGSWLDAVERLSGWVPTVTIVPGVGFAGPANLAALSDCTIMVRGGSTIGMAGPRLVKAGVGEDLTAEQMGAAELQADRNGAVELAVDSDAETVAAARRYLSYLPANARAPLPVQPVTDPVDRRCPELRDLVPTNLRRGYDVRKVIDAIVDVGSAFEIRPTNARNLVTAFARLGGIPVGIVANQAGHLAGILDAAACRKGARFVGICDAFGLPLVYLMDTPGFLVGMGAEESNLVRWSARFLSELGAATVPRCSVILRKGYGLAYYAMAGGRSHQAELAVAWPQAQISAMSIEGAIDVLYRHEYGAAADPAARRQEIIDDFLSRADALRAADGFGIDDVIDPADTRAVLCDALAIAPRRRPARNDRRIRPVPPI
ncbi:MAG: acyl-CoA carboxylase [Acidimicrobiales bacterium]|nr:acyl-CoA carboxylase [Acidimicrobiales bacterium]